MQQLVDAARLRVLATLLLALLVLQLLEFERGALVTLAGRLLEPVLLHQLAQRDRQILVAVRAALGKLHIGCARQTHGRRQLLSIDLKHIENRLVALQKDRAHVRDERLLREVLEIGRLGEGRRKLRRGRLQLFRIHLDLFDRDALRLHLIENGRLGRQQQQQTVAGRLVPRGAPGAVNVGRDRVGAVELHDPIDAGEIEAARGNVGGKEHSGGLFDKVIVNRHALGLLHLAMNLHQRNTRVQPTKSLEQEAHLLARRDKDNALGFEVRANERVQHVKLLMRVAQHVGLHELNRSGLGRAVMHGHVLGLLQRQLGQLLDRLGLRRREEQGLPRLGQVLHNRRNRGLESEVENAVGLVEHEHLQVVAIEARRLVHVLQQAPRRAD